MYIRYRSFHILFKKYILRTVWHSMPHPRRFQHVDHWSQKLTDCGFPSRTKAALTRNNICPVAVQ